MYGKADSSLKFGSGRFLMQRGMLEAAGEEIHRYGTKPFFVGGPTAISLVESRLTESLKKEGIEGVFSVHPGHVCHEEAQPIAQEAKDAGCDVVVAVGGGRSMDFGKLVAYYVGAPVVMLPTSIATCAAFSPFSLIYTPEGQTLPGHFSYDHENSAIMIDLDIMVRQPARLVVSGMLDAMAKFVEIKNGHADMPEEGTSIPQYAGFLLARYGYEKLDQKIFRVLEDMEAGRITRELEDMVFLNIPLPGIISGLSHGVGQSAIAHELYYQGRRLYTQDMLKSLHGELVGLGLVPQYYYNGETEKAKEFIRFLDTVGAPSSLTKAGFVLTDENMNRLCDAIANTRFVDKDAQSVKRLREGMELIAR